MKTDTDKYEQI